MSKVYRYRINNTVLLFSAIIYISPKGDDLKGDGTLLKPFNTIKKATTMVNISNTAIILLDGIYNERVIDYGSNTGCGKHSIFSTKDKQITFIGQGAKTIINTEFNKANCSVVSAGISNLDIYNVVVKVDCKYAGDINSNVMLAGNSIYDSTVNVYNSIFEFLVSSNQKGIYHDNVKGQINVMNCMFHMGDVTNSWSGYGNTSYVLKLQNCIIKDLLDWRSFGGGNKPPKISFFNTIKNNDNCYNQYNTMTDNGGNFVFDIITNTLYYPINTNKWRNSGLSSIRNFDNSISHIGPYGGPHQWNASTIIPATINLNSQNITVEKNQQCDFGFKINPTYTENASIEIQSIIESFNDNTSVTYLYNINKKNWINIKSFEIW